MHDALRTLIPLILKDSHLHARWLNTFSYLEYIGFRKILKSQEAGTLGAETLAHAVEEGRHALRLKKMAVRMGGGAFDTYSADSLLCRKEAEAYFQTLDHACESQLAGLKDGKRLTYLYVTWLVELRALEVYGAYQNALPANQENLLHGLLAEEARHLASVSAELKEKDPSFSSRFPRLQALESSLCENFFTALHGELSREPHAAV